MTDNRKCLQFKRDQGGMTLIYDPWLDSEVEGKSSINSITGTPFKIWNKCYKLDEISTLNVLNFDNSDYIRIYPCCWETDIKALGEKGMMCWTYSQTIQK